ncbi:maltose alpha-D-glucosyltransferase [Bordetella sp. 02P26C-1]|uniref:maltose alpha-D-glucosyltransferase n=1 Tax=Bordetella sp. 02P26C-1 TaxID=2683195 RepID=UPI0013522859|nr:maltose alpha-D-glucosyltransferase [Bordetella sp. 02P26C-1]MVW79881.1 maltose alpha-D-glucosyltransferase [Bordetella sp. 02P26C-1]
MTQTFNDDPLWFKDAVVYQLHVKSFFDANNDGIGDLPGLLAKLDYIASLGVTAIWLLPFYPSPRRDDGYDIADYRSVHTDYGTVSDLRRLIRAAHARGLRVITELVVNHTSDQHPWFQRARRAKPGSVARNYYVWSDTDRAYDGTRIIFCDTETSNWTWDPVANAYYWHRFYSHQPDLNYDNPHVLREVLGVMRYWLDMGVDGLRLDAVPYLVEREGTNNENLPETHAVLKKIRAVVEREYPGRMLLAEANQWPEDAQEYFGQGDECHMSFHFPLMPRMYMAIAQEDRFPILDIMRQTPDIPENCQWAIFLRNHDELTLEMVTSRERDYLWKVYAADTRARINLGIRRRLGPLLERDRRRVELMNSLLLSMPGTPVLYYGDEIGMGDNIHLGDRDGVRTPMQWSADRNGGFSRADPERLQLPPIMSPLYGYEAINVEAQQRDPHSLLNWTRRMLAQRGQTQAFGRGTLKFLSPGNRKILAYLRQWQDTTILCVANLSASAQPVELPLQQYAGAVPVEMLGGSVFPAIGELPYLLTLPPYGFYWFTLSREASAPSWHTQTPEQMPELVTLVLKPRGDLALTEGARRVLENEVLPEYLARQRWYPGSAPQDLKLGEVIPLPGHVGRYYWVSIQHAADKPPLQMPVALVWGEQAEVHYPAARLRRGAELGFLADGCLQESFIRALVDGLRQGASDARLVFRPEPGAREITEVESPSVRWLGAEQSNSSAIVDDHVMVKVLRSPSPGPSWEAEMGRRLTAAGFTNTPALLGTLERKHDNGSTTLALFHQFVANEGDAWGWTLDYLRRVLDPALVAGEEAEAFEERLAGYMAFVRIVGQRLAQMHAALFDVDAEPGDPEETVNRINGQLRDALAALKKHRADLPPALQASAQWLEEHAPRLETRIRDIAALEQNVPRQPVHGDFHLGQVLVVQTDAYLIDFEGEPLRDADARQAPDTVYKDLAGLLRSFDYAASVGARTTALAPAAPETTGAPPADALAGTMTSRHDALLCRFRTLASEAFLQGYREARTPTAEISAQDEAALLSLAQLEKAAYEVCYEAAHRPTWIPVPLAALAELGRELLLSAAVRDDSAAGGQV